MSAPNGRMVALARVRVGAKHFCTPSHSFAATDTVASVAARFRTAYLADAVVEFKFFDPALVNAPPLPELQG